MTNLRSLSFLLLVAYHAAQASAPVPYKWGVYKPVTSYGKEKIILVDWFSPEGKKRLSKSSFKQDFYQLAHMYQPQINPVFAGIATSVIILNAMRLPKHSVASQPELEIQQPRALGGELVPFPAYSQRTFLNAETDKVKDRHLIDLSNVTPQNQDDKTQFKPGTGLSDLKGLLSVYKVKVDIVFAETATPDEIDQFRKTAKRVLNEEKQFLIANFKGDMLGAATSGTVSPIAAYDEKTDSLLILDVTGHKNPWYWVPVTDFYRSMNTSYDGNSRGYAILEDQNT